MHQLNKPIPSQTFVRDQGDGKSIILCVVPTDCIPKNLHKGAFLVGDIMLFPKKAFDAKAINGWLAEDIFRESHDLSEMDEIPLWDATEATEGG